MFAGTEEELQTRSITPSSCIGDPDDSDRKNFDSAIARPVGVLLVAAGASLKDG
jgi:hypothetical protein